MEGSKSSKVVLVTGGSSGLGEAIGRSCLAAGYRVVLAARRADRLDAIAAQVGAPDRLLTLAADVRDPAAIERMVALTLQHWGRVDVLVANAGVGHPEGVLDMSEEHLMEQVDVNALAVVRCCRAVLPQMVERGSGHVLVISSVAAEIAPPDAVIYAASKGFVATFTEAMRREVEPHGIRVTNIIPGFIQSEMTARNRMKMPPASEIGDLVVRLLRRPRSRAVYPRWYGAGIWLQRFAPRLMDRAILVMRSRI